MPAMEAVAGAVVASASLLIGIPVNAMVICYLRGKPIYFKTPFDSIVADTIAKSTIGNIANYVLYIVCLSTETVAYEWAVALTALNYVLLQSFIASWFVTFLTKYLYLVRGGWMFEQSDRSIQLASQLGKVGLTLLWSLIDNYGPFSRPFIQFQFLVKDPEIESPLKLGVGFIMSLTSTVFLAGYLQYLLETHPKHQYPQEEKVSKRLLLIIGCVLIISMLVLYNLSEGVLFHFLLIVPLIIRGQIVPLFTILPNKRLRSFFKNRVGVLNQP